MESRTEKKGPKKGEMKWGPRKWRKTSKPNL